MDSGKLNREIRVADILGLRNSAEIKKHSLELGQLILLKDKNNSSIEQMQKYLLASPPIGIQNLKDIKDTRNFMQQLNNLKNSKLEENVVLENLNEQKTKIIQTLNNKAKLIQNKKEIALAKFRSIREYLKME